MAFLSYEKLEVARHNAAAAVEENRQLQAKVDVFQDDRRWLRIVKGKLLSLFS